MKFKNEKRWLNYQLDIDRIGLANRKVQHVIMSIIGQTYEAECTKLEESTLLEIVEKLKNVKNQLDYIAKKMVELNTEKF